MPRDLSEFTEEYEAALDKAGTRVLKKGAKEQAWGSFDDLRKIARKAIANPNGPEAQRWKRMVIEGIDGLGPLKMLAKQGLKNYKYASNLERLPEMAREYAEAPSHGAGIVNFAKEWIDPVHPLGRALHAQDTSQWGAIPESTFKEAEEQQREFEREFEEGLPPREPAQQEPPVDSILKQAFAKEPKPSPLEGTLPWELGLAQWRPEGVGPEITTEEKEPILARRAGWPATSTGT